MTTETETDARVKRAHELAHDIKDLASDLRDRVREMQLELGMNVPEIRQVVGNFERPIVEAIDSVLAPTPELAWHPPMRKVIDRLFAEAPKMTDASGKDDATQAPAMQCRVLLRTAPQELYGALSVTPEGTLRMLAVHQIAPQQRGDKPKLIALEWFFGYEDVLAIVVEREPPGIGGSRIVAG